MIIRQLEIIKLLLNEKIEEKIDFVDILLSLTLDVIRFEIKLFNSISDETGNAISQITSFLSIEYYYHQDFIELDKELKELTYQLREYNLRLKNHELGGVVGIDNKNWIEYFSKSLLKLHTELGIGEEH